MCGGLFVRLKWNKPQRKCTIYFSPSNIPIGFRKPCFLPEHTENMLNTNRFYFGALQFCCLLVALERTMVMNFFAPCSAR